MKASVWNTLVLGGVGVGLALIALATAVIDPFWHYHGPVPGLEYPLLDERYQNDGIERHFVYDAIITGTSMTQNFKPSQFNRLWGANAIKVSFSGASYKEVNDNINRALSYNENVRYVVRSLDGSLLIYPADQNQYEGYPEYLYDENPFNDAAYLLNKDVIPKTIAVVNYTRAGHKTPTMDEYGRWSQYKVFGKEEVLRTISVLPEFEEEHKLTEEDYVNIRENVRRNVLDTALAHPDITFYMFFPPYSIYYWGALAHTKQLSAQLEAETMATEMLLQAENVKVFDFTENMEMIANLDNYTDSLHYGEWVNEDILNWMYEGKYELTSDNFARHFEEIEEMFLKYDYSYLYE